MLPGSRYGPVRRGSAPAHALRYRCWARTHRPAGLWRRGPDIPPRPAIRGRPVSYPPMPDCSCRPQRSRQERLLTPGVPSAWAVLSLRSDPIVARFVVCAGNGEGGRHSFPCGCESGQPGYDGISSPASTRTVAQGKWHKDSGTKTVEISLRRYYSISIFKHVDPPRSVYHHPDDKLWQPFDRGAAL